MANPININLRSMEMTEGSLRPFPYGFFSHFLPFFLSFFLEMEKRRMEYGSIRLSFVKCFFPPHNRALFLDVVFRYL